MKQVLRFFALAALGWMSTAALAGEKYHINTHPIPDNTVLRGVRVIDGTGAAPMEDMAIVIHKKKIVAVGPNAQIRTPRHAEELNWNGKTVIPGLIDGHAHLGLVLHDKAEGSADAYTEANVVGELYLYQRYGVTTVNSLGLNPDLVYDLRKRQRQGLIGGSRLLTAGRGIAIEGGAPPLTVKDDAIYRVKNPEEAREAVRAMAKQKVDVIKVWVDSLRGSHPSMNPAIYKAVIDEAHQHRLPVAAHVYYLADAKDLVASGVNILAHSVRDAGIDQELIDAMKAKGTWYIPTLAADESTFTYLDHPEFLEGTFVRLAAGPELSTRLADTVYKGKIAADRGTTIKRQDLATAMQNLRRAAEAGVNIGFGTDAGAQPVRIPGVSEHRELQLMVQAGLTPMQAITIATSKSAAMLHQTDTGVIAVGKTADLLVLDGDPLTQIENTEKILGVWHNGQRVGELATQ